MTFSPDGKVALHNTDTWEQKATWTVSLANVLSLAFSHDGKLLAMAGSERKGQSWGAVFHIWDAVTGEQRAIFRGHTSHAGLLAFSPDDRTLATGGRDGMVKLWDLRTYKERLNWRADAQEVLALALSPDGQTLATTGPEMFVGRGGRDTEDNRFVRLWDPATGKEKDWFQPLPNGAVCLRFSPDGKLLAVGYKNMELWDLKTLQPRAVLQGHQAHITAIVFSADGQTVFTGSKDHTIKVWDVPEALRRWRRLHPDGWKPELR